jgi:hypothetical protein
MLSTFNLALANYLGSIIYTFEIGGRNKYKSQIAGIKNAFIAQIILNMDLIIESPYGYLVSCTEYI